ncbi:LuxR family transcriptional regulator [Rhodococcus sp. 14-2483-1-2]|uniref:helix-turn-helix transcriptional regulator n=1 Tax=Rhodococcus sp. 14-2483-1-2 TaxID=2023147 RepID=UPI000B9C709C|nr:LuxR family transcriptional regulator [Rhodococcus sp. 14-2483-1-2]OZF30566.1 hypothetical protein CH295_15880 [Rhodococcus sp. 14-2483-1-2]
MAVEKRSIGEVPLIGRDGELQRILHAAGRYGGMAVKAAPGVGRTRLLTEAVRSLVKLGWHPHRVVTVMPTGTGFVPVESDRALAATLADAHGGRRTVVVIDDAQWLADSTIELLARRVGSKDLFVLASVSAGRRRTPVLDALWKDGVIDRIDLEPLTLQQCRSLIESMLGRNGEIVDSAAVFAVTALSSGNLVALRDLVATALERRALTVTSHVWHLSAPLPVSAGLADVVRDHLAEVIALADYAGAAEIDDALDMVAVAGSLAFGAAAAVMDPRLIEELESAGVLTIRAEQNIDRVMFSTPITAQVRTEDMATLRRRRLSLTVADALDASTDGLGPRERVTAALLRIDAGVSLDAPTAVEAARLSWRYVPPETTRKLASAAAAAGGGFDAQLVLASAESQLGMTESAQQRLDELLRGADNDIRRATAVRACTDNMVLRLADPARALALNSSTEHAVVDPAIRTQLRAQRGLMMHAIGDTAGSLALLEPLMDDLVGATLISASFAVAAGATVAGRLSTAFSALARVQPEPDNPAATVLDLTRCFTIACAGNFEEATSLARYRYDEAVEQFSPLQQAWFGWARGGLLLSQGHAAEAIRWCSEAYTLAGTLGQRSMEPMVACDLVRALALDGRPEEASALIEAADLDNPASPALFGARGTRLAALGWAAAARGDVDDACELLIASAEAHAAIDHHLPALFSYVDAARCGAAAAALAPVHQLAGLIEGDLARTEVRMVEVLAAPSTPNTAVTEQVVAVAASAEKHGLDLHAAEMYFYARNLLLRTSPRAAATAGRQGRVLAARCGHPSTPLLNGTRDPALTARESQIASLAASGLSNRDIAAAVVLSIRTVETHLNRIFGKLGISTRAELTSLRGSLLD